MSNLTAYANVAQPDRAHIVRLVRGQKVTITANFNAMLPADETITSATWYAESAGTISLASIDGPLVSVALEAGWSSGGRLKCDATFSDGAKASLLYCIASRRGPYFQGEPTASVPTSQTLTVTNP